MDSVGREVALLSVMQLQNNKEALLEVVRGIVAPSNGIATSAVAPEAAAAAPITTPANEPAENANREGSAPIAMEKAVSEAAPQAGELATSELTLC